MQCSHLLSHREEAKRFLFGGSYSVPDIPSLQRFLELAWNNGFDVSGALHFNSQISGSKRWIGTTECAALLRFFWLKARVVDFAPKKSQSMYLSVPGSSLAPKRKSYGSMDIYVTKKRESGKEKTVDSHGSNSNSSKISKGAVLMDWVWNYFSGNKLNVSSGVHMTSKGPCIFNMKGTQQQLLGFRDACKELHSLLSTVS